MNKKQKSIAFLDVNTFANEEFTSGLLITVREILRRFREYGVKTNILSVAQGIRTRDWESHKKLGERSRIIQSFEVNEVLLSDSPEKDQNSYIEAVESLLNKHNPDVILMNTAAVFLEEFHILSLEKTIESNKKVIVLLVDTLFPTYETHPKDKVERYYELLNKAEIISSSQRIIDYFYKKTGIKAICFKNLYTVNEVLSPKHSHKYITLINHHPIKGREIFDAIVKKLPHKKYLVVQTWPDVPEYVLPSDNVTFSNFTVDIRDLYSKIRILLVPSLCQEGPARVIIEAMLNGIPVIAHRIGSIPEIGDKYVHLVDPPDISNIKLEGTILTPQLKENDLNRVADDFVSIINSIDNGPETWGENSEKAKEYALEYCTSSEELFKEYINKLLADIT